MASWLSMLGPCRLCRLLVIFRSATHSSWSIKMRKASEFHKHWMSQPRWLLDIFIQWPLVVNTLRRLLFTILLHSPVSETKNCTYVECGCSLIPTSLTLFSFVQTFAVPAQYTIPPQDVSANTAVLSEMLIRDLFLTVITTLSPTTFCPFYHYTLPVYSLNISMPFSLKYWQMDLY